MRSVNTFNEREQACSTFLSDDEIKFYVRLKNVCPNHFKGYLVQAQNLERMLRIDGLSSEDKTENLFHLLDKFMKVDLIFYESYPVKDRGEVVSIIFTAFAGLFNESECQDCGALIWSKYE